MIIPRDLPKHECLQAFAELMPGVDAGAVEASLVLIRVAGDILARIESALNTHGLSQARFTVLILLMKRASAAGEDGRAACAAPMTKPTQQMLEHAVATPSELADECGVTRATVTGLLDGLEREGLIVRERPALAEHGSPAGDRRHVRVRLTPKAAALMAKVVPECLALHSKLLGAVPETKRAAMVRTLLELRTHIFAAGQDAAAAAAQGPPAGSA